MQVHIAAFWGGPGMLEGPSLAGDVPLKAREALLASTLGTGPE